MSDLRIHVRRSAQGFTFGWWPEAAREHRRPSPLVHRARVPAGPAEVEALATAIDLAAQAIGRLPGAPPGEDALRRLGGLMHARLIPPVLVATLADLPSGATISWATDAPDLPWELIHDGRDFLALRHPMVRVLITDLGPGREPLAEATAPSTLLIANPTGDLAQADAEAEALLEAYDATGEIVCELLARDQAAAPRVVEALASGAYAVIHFAGHARPGALRLADGWLEADTIAKALRGAPLVVLNACASARSTPGPADSSGPASPPSAPADPSAEGHGGSVMPAPPKGLVEALLRGGACGVVGQLWPIFDERAGRMGPALHRGLIEGETVAVALRRARQVARELSPSDVGWAAAALWSDPHVRPFPARPRRQPGSVLVARFGEAAEGRASVARLGRALAEASDAITRRGGQVLARDDRGMHAVFGLPRVLEDDAPRALAAALEIRQRLAASGVGVGVASGELEIGPDPRPGFGPLVVGEVLTRARRLAVDAAKGRHGPILVDEAAGRLAEAAFRSVAIAEDGSLPRGARRLLAPRTRVERSAPPPLEGRTTELGALAGHWGAARSSRGCVVGVVGDAGIGKSHLLASFRDSLTGVGHHWLEVRPSVGGDPPYAVVGRLLRLLLDLEDGPGRPAGVAQAIEARLPEVELSSRLRALVEEVCGAPGEAATPSEPEEARGLLVDLLRRLLARTAGEAPLVLALEDLHRLDEASETVLARVCEGVGRQPILVLVLTRPEEGGAPAPWSRMQAYRPLAMGPLDASAQRALIARLLETRPEALPSALDPLRERTGGNPLFLEESLRALREQGRLLCRDGRWHLRGEVDSSGAPESLRRVMLARFDQLDGEMRQVLDTAAVAGDPVEPGILDAVLGLSCEPSLGELEARGFLRARWSSGDYRFHHDVVREMAAGALAPSRRRALHRRVARTLEEQAAGGAADADTRERLARHWQAVVTDVGGEPVAGADPRDIERAVRRLNDAGRSAHRRLASRAALRRFEAAARLLEPKAGIDLDPDLLAALSAEAHAGVGDAQNRLGDFDAAIVAYTRAATTLDGEDAAEARVRLADLARRIGRLHAWGGRYDEALDWLDRGQRRLGERLRDEERGVAAHLHVQRGVVQYWRGQMDEALAHVQRGLGIAEGTGHEEALATGHNVLGAVSDARGEREAAEAAYERSLSLWHALGDDYQAARVADNLGVTYYHLGRWEDAALAHRQALAFFERIEDRDQAAFARINLGNVGLGRGNWEEAAALFQGAQEEATAVGNARISALACLNHGLVELERPDLDAAAALLEASEATIDEHGLEDMAAEVHVARGRLALRQGDPAMAEQRAREALRLAQAHALQLEEALARRLLGQVLARGGAVEEALAHLRWSRGALAGLSHRHELGRTLVALAHVLRQRGGEGGADEVLEEARRLRAEAGAIFEALGARADRVALGDAASGAA